MQEWLVSLRTSELDFLEGGSEVVTFERIAITRTAPRGAAWAASLAAAMRPHIFGLGAAPFALGGLMPRSVFREHPDEPLPVLVRSALLAASTAAVEDLSAMRQAIVRGDAALASLYVSSRAPQVWQTIVGLGPLTRAELARALGTTKRTASQAVATLGAAGLTSLRPGDAAVVINPDREGVRPL